MDNLENAQRRAEYWKAEHSAANAEIERLNAAMLTAASLLERDGDEHNIGYALRRALTPNS